MESPSQEDLFDKRPFRPGERYRVAKSVSGFGGPFVIGEELTFVVGAYSRYDDCYLYEFEDDSGNKKTWAAGVDEAPDSWRSIFVEL